MIAKIVALLQQRKPNAPPEWLKKLPQMAKRLEESLYRNAGDFESYNGEPEGRSWKGPKKRAERSEGRRV